MARNRPHLAFGTPTNIRRQRPFSRGDAGPIADGAVVKSSQPADGIETVGVDVKVVRKQGIGNMNKDDLRQNEIPGPGNTGLESGYGRGLTL